MCEMFLLRGDLCRRQVLDRKRSLRRRRGTPGEGQHWEKKGVGICMKVSAVVNSRHSVNLPPHHKKRNHFLRKDCFKQSYGWERLPGFSQLTFPSLSWGQARSGGVK